MGLTLGEQIHFLFQKKEVKKIQDLKFSHFDVIKYEQFFIVSYFG